MAPGRASRRIVFVTSVLLVRAGASPVSGQGSELLDLVPAESLVCWLARPVGEAPPSPEPPSTLQTLLELGTRVAGQPLDSGTRLNLRLAELLGLTARYPHAVFLLDAQAAPTPAGSVAPRVNQIQAALIVRTGESSEPFLRIIQKAVNEQTDSGAATLETRRTPRHAYQELRDARLPSWAVIAWGHIGGLFVLSVGPDVWPTIAAVASGDAPAIGQDRWYAEVRRHQPRALVEIFVATRRIQARLDPLVDGRASAFFRAWGAEELDQAHWAVGFEGRAAYCRAAFRTGEQIVRHLYVDPSERDPRLLAAVPQDATYAVVQVAARWLLPRLAHSFLALTGARTRAKLERRWEQNQIQSGVEFERDVLARLGDRILVHNDPPHPLRIPLAGTVLMTIEEQPESVRQALESLCAAWQATLDAVDASGDRTAPFTLQRDDDGVWYLRFGWSSRAWLGLAGPAWTVTDRFLILSWSPLALREYLDKAERAVR